MYEWKPKKGILHTKEAIRAAQYFAEMFINEARHSNHTFGSRAAEQTELIYNYPITYTGLKGNSYEQCYLFKENVGKKIVEVNKENVGEKIVEVNKENIGKKIAEINNQINNHI